MPLLIETMASEKKYWKGFDELGNTPVAQKLAQNEFAEDLPVEAILGDGALLESANTWRRYDSRRRLAGAVGGKV